MSEIIVLGDKTGVIRQKVDRIDIERKQVASAKKGQEIGIEIPGSRKGDLVYLVVKR